MLVNFVEDERANFRINAELDEDQMFIVPKGVRHNPVAESQCPRMLIECQSTHHAGTVTQRKTQTLSEQLRPV